MLSPCQQNAFAWTWSRRACCVKDTWMGVHWTCEVTNCGLDAFLVPRDGPPPRSPSSSSPPFPLSCMGSVWHLQELRRLRIEAEEVNVACGWGVGAESQALWSACDPCCHRPLSRCVERDGRLYWCFMKIRSHSCGASQRMMLWLLVSELLLLHFRWSPEWPR